MSPEEAERRVRELLPAAVLILLTAAALALIIACFATGVCEAVIITAAAGVAVAALVIFILRGAGVDVRGGPGEVPIA